MRCLFRFHFLCLRQKLTTAGPMYFLKIVGIILLMQQERLVLHMDLYPLFHASLHNTRITKVSVLFLLFSFFAKYIFFKYFHLFSHCCAVNSFKCSDILCHTFSFVVVELNSCLFSFTSFISLNVLFFVQYFFSSTCSSF